MDEYDSFPMPMPFPGTSMRLGSGDENVAFGMEPQGGSQDLPRVSQVSVLGQESRTKDRLLLQDMVREFARASMTGQECQILEWDPKGGCPMGAAPKPAHFSLDGEFQNFRVRPS